jgi:hypothetical protein
MRYRVNTKWPVQGGAMMIPGGTIIDDAQPDQWSSAVRGVIPPPDVTPLDQATRDWLVNAYRHLPDHHHQFPLVEVGNKQQEEAATEPNKRKTKSK